MYAKHTGASSSGLNANHLLHSPSHVYDRHHQVGRRLGTPWQMYLTCDPQITVELQQDKAAEAHRERYKEWGRLCKPLTGFWVKGEKREAVMASMRQGGGASGWGGVGWVWDEIGWGGIRWGGFGMR